MGASLGVEIAGEPVALLADRALYWPRHRRLLIADLHLGKADIFRRLGIGLPSGGTAHDLARLDALFALTDARELWILGDVLHGPAHDAAWRGLWAQWRERHASRLIVALTGNHDRALAGVPLGIELAGECVDEPPFALRHEPVGDERLHVIGGHIHPCVGLPGLGSRRWPAFWLREGLTVLPAFSAFTGGVAVEAGIDEQLALCVDGTIVLVRGPPAQVNRRWTGRRRRL